MANETTKQISPDDLPDDLYLVGLVVDGAYDRLMQRILKRGDTPENMKQARLEVSMLAGTLATFLARCIVTLSAGNRDRLEQGLEEWAAILRLHAERDFAGIADLIQRKAN